MSNSLYIIIVTYNAEKWIDKCFSGFINMPANWKVIAIDNNSSDNTLEILNMRYPFVETIEIKENLGFAKANNIGLAMALNDDVDNVLLLNQDAWISIDDIKKLIEVQNKNTDYYILTPLHYNGSETALDYGFSEYIMSCKELLKDAVSQQLKKEVYSTNYCNAAMWLLSKDCLKDIGGFNPSFYHYGEDDNYLHRLFYQNKKLGIVPTTKGCHDREARPPSPIFSKTLAVEYRTKVLLPLSNPNVSNYNEYMKIFFRYFFRFVFYALIFKFGKSKHCYTILFKYIKEQKTIYLNLIKSKRKQANFIEGIL